MLLKLSEWQRWSERCALFPNQGRLHELALRVVGQIRLGEAFNPRKLKYHLEAPVGSLLFVRSEDIPSLLYNGVGSIGLTGRDYVLEADVDLHVLDSLNVCCGHLALQVRSDSSISSVAELPNAARVVSQYPRFSVRAIHGANRHDVDVIPISGAAETYVSAGMADGSIDVIASGETAAANSIKVAAHIAYTSAVLVCRGRKPSWGQFETEIVRAAVTAARQLEA